MRVRYNQICYAPDRKSEDGSWLQTWTEPVDGVMHQHHSIAGIMWRKLVNRCNPECKSNKVKSRYYDVKNLFQSFQDFANWAMSQPGYGIRDKNGRLWHIDKDILAMGRREYSRYTCCFVPALVNTFIITGNHNPSLPLGVSKDARRSRFSAQCNVKGKTIRLGTYSSALEAHKAWQAAKSTEIVRVAEWHNSLESSDTRVTVELFNMADKIISDMNCGITTFSVLRASE